MPNKKKKARPTEKLSLHPRNKHRQRYNFEVLTSACPELGPYVKVNTFNDESIDFSIPEAVKMLNKSLLIHYYGIEYWDIPAGYLCPPVPGRADYIHHIAEFLGVFNEERIPTGTNIRCLDIGVGANCIYPIIGLKEYGWSFVGSEIDERAIESASKIIKENAFLKGHVEIRLQANANDIFTGIIQDEYFDLSICNPPFHASHDEAQSASRRKVRNLKNKRISNPILNFGGHKQELYCDGGEEIFVQKMIIQSKEFASSCFYFSTIISKESHLKSIYSALNNVKVQEIMTIPMSQGNKKSRIVAWTFLNKEQQQLWVSERWNK